MKIKGVARSDRRRDRQKAAHASGWSGLGARPQRRWRMLRSIQSGRGCRDKNGKRNKTPPRVGEHAGGAGSPPQREGPDG